MKYTSQEALNIGCSVVVAGVVVALVIAYMIFS